MTKNALKAKIQMAVNLAALTKSLCNDICDALTTSPDDDIYALTDNIQSYERTDVAEIMKQLEDDGYFADAHITEDGPAIAVPEITLGSPQVISIEIPVGNNSRLIAGTCVADCETPQAFIDYKFDDCGINIALAEIKKDELAKASSLPADNKDIDVYVWSDPHTEDYTHSHRIKFDDIAKELSDD